MIQLGFQFYDEKTVLVPPTTAEIVASLSGVQKTAVLNGFVCKTRPAIIAGNNNIDTSIVIHLYQKIDEIEESARKIMRGEILITPAEYDEGGVEITPAVYNEPPNTSTQLKNIIKDDFKEEFTEQQVTAILTKMIQCSKYNGLGNWAFYSSQVKL